MYRTLWLCIVCITALSLSSCSLIIRTVVGLHDPVVETRESITQFIQESGHSYDYNYILKSEPDSAAIFNNLFRCGSNKILIFDNNGTRYCYNTEDSTSCPGNLYTMAFTVFDSNFSPCAIDSLRFADYLRRLEPLRNNGKSLHLNDSSYYLIYYWAKFMGGKKKYNEEVQWLTGMQKTSNKNIIILGVNTDLQESWGLIAGKKMRMKLKVRGHGGTAEFGPIPYSDKPRIVSHLMMRRD